MDYKICIFPGHVAILYLKTTYLMYLKYLVLLVFLVYGVVILYASKGFVSFALTTAASGKDAVLHV